VSAAASQQAPPASAPAYPPPPAAAPMAAAPAVPAKRGLSPIVWVLIIVGGLFLLGVISVVGAGLFFVHKAHQAGFDSELMQRNPGYAAAKMIIAMNSEVEEVSHDEAAGTITVREKKTGKVTTMNFGDVKNGHFTFSAQDETGKTGSIEFGEGAGKLPSWVPVYPGAKAEGEFSAKVGSGDQAEGGTVMFSTSDAWPQVVSFYQDKAKALGMKTSMTTSTDKGGFLVFADEDGKRTLSVTAGGGGSAGRCEIGLTYAVKK
jgi:hypothetical protein